jgi:hypothetical protein
MTATVENQLAGGNVGQKVVAYGARSAPVQDVTDANGLPTRVDGVSDGAITAAWDGTAVNSNGYGSAFVEVTACPTPITIKGGILAANPMQVINLADGSVSNTITATGLYAVPAVGSLTATGIGAGVVNLKLKR